MECQSLWTDGENKKFQNLISNDTREMRGKKLTLHKRPKKASPFPINAYFSVKLHMMAIFE